MHSNWIRGSYVADLQFLLKIAENHPLSLNPLDTNIGPDIDSKDRLVIG